jgi:hypothetical protein
MKRVGEEEEAEEEDEEEDKWLGLDQVPTTLHLVKKRFSQIVLVHRTDWSCL